MKLLILTQKVDLDDDVLGFFHGWIIKLAEHWEKITVICLYQGNFKLPSNVKVLSLGKERLEIGNLKLEIWRKLFGRMKYIFLFYKYLWLERGNYDQVFVHMNAIYVFLAGWYWRMKKRPVGLWYNHIYGNVFARGAGRWANMIFYTSRYSFFAKWPQAKAMPAGIDINLFKRLGDCQPQINSILSLGRIGPIKSIDVLVKAGQALDKKNIDFQINIVGDKDVGEDKYFQELKQVSADLVKRNKLSWQGRVVNSQAPVVYNQNEIVVNLTNPGSLDKTILEAMACERVVLVSNLAIKKMLSEKLQPLLIFQERDANDLSRKLEYLLNLDRQTKKQIGQELRQLVLKHHSFTELINQIKISYGR